MAYKMYLDGELMPVTPAKIKMKITNQNKTITLIGGEEINMLNAPGLTEISFDLRLPQSRYHRDLTDFSKPVANKGIFTNSAPFSFMRFQLCL